MKYLFIIAILFLFGACQQQNNVELIDLHIHLKGDLTIEEAIKKSENEGLKYGIAANCGLGFPIQTDEQIAEYIKYMRQYPQFYIGMQAEGREWLHMFSPEAINLFDYVFTDAMTFTDAKGRRNRIWIKEETWIDDEQEFMDYLVATTEKIINTEPIDIYVNPTFLPAQMEDRYNEFWTTERMMKVIEAAKSKNVAIEINNRFEIPSEKFIKLAKAEGVLFTIGTNNVDKNFPRPLYAEKMIKACELSNKNFWKPEMKANN
ncbi:MAG TPA: hypothetical protein PLS94_00265 [Prolixibacteraceae bacterium]|nr:hypothetical protein [Prolixibacteraceae bacterium]